MSQKIEKQIVKRMVSDLGKAGWKPVCVYDSEEYVDAKSCKAVCDIVFSVDESTVTFAKPGHRNQGVLLIPGNGNDGWDLITDNNCGDTEFAAVMDSVTDWCIKTEEARWVA